MQNLIKYIKQGDYTMLNSSYNFLCNKKTLRKMGIFGASGLMILFTLLICNYFGNQFLTEHQISSLQGEDVHTPRYGRDDPKAIVASSILFSLLVGLVTYEALNKCLPSWQSSMSHNSNIITEGSDETISGVAPEV